MIKVTSPATIKYNCVSWVVGDDRRIWWPDEDYYWPENISMEPTMDCFIEMFESLGYERCSGNSFEDGYNKVAIFCNDDGLPTHVARQLHNGLWTSKLGNLADVEHELYELTRDPMLVSYGRVVAIMRHKI